ncbi:MAG: YegS/Rv2252/BmrU family lipid kinase [Christensenellaceae bacterium]|nr:YegS/Rv2252/BmrU family lipid kinase [Christensenellaceae bacterium]MCI5915721.1 YegS/Rv2252/BmrU family lipid kinase [Christensenella sp.]
MEKRLLLVMNPCAGIKKANRYLPDLLRLFSDYGYVSTAYMTGKRGDGTEFARTHAAEADLIVCIGGDGTLNEVIEGLLKSGADCPLGYIPAGSTNDFAASLKISSNVMQAARDIMEGRPRTIDLGSFNGRCFSYVASFGAFTEAAYSTPQEVKNMLGHLAYIFEGMKDLANIRPIHMRLETDSGNAFEDDYIFGAISNSTSIAGFLTMDPTRVIIDDGLFEITLIKMPTAPMDLSRILYSLQTQQYDDKLIHACTAARAVIHSPAAVPWTLDGEYARGETDIIVENLHNALRLVVNET